MLAEILAALPAAMKVVDLLSQLAKDNGASDAEILSAIESRGTAAIKDLDSQIKADQDEEKGLFPAG